MKYFLLFLQENIVVRVSISISNIFSAQVFYDSYVFIEMVLEHN